MFSPIRLNIPTIPQPKLRARIDKRGWAFTPKKTESAEAEIRWHWNASKHQMIPKYPTVLEVWFFLPKPASAKKSQVYPVVRPDLDNLVKLVKDALNGFAWKDDGQIIETHAFKRYGDPRIAIQISPKEGT